MARHEKDRIDEDPVNPWVRKWYTADKATDVCESAEQETDRDLDKPIEQLLCDVHDGHQNWVKKFGKSDQPSEMDRAVELVLYTLARTASMNAVVAKSNEQLQKQIGVLTRIVVYLSFGMFLVMALQACAQFL